MPVVPEYNYIAWNEIPGLFDVGSYAGNSTGAGNNDNRNITSSTAATTAGLTFQPEDAIVKSVNAAATVQHTASFGRSTDTSIGFTATASATNLIQALGRTVSRSVTGPPPL